MSKTTTKRLALLGHGCAAGAFLLLAGAPALAAQSSAGEGSPSGGMNKPSSGAMDQPSAGPTTSTEQMITSTFTVEDIDKSRRMLTVKGQDGEKTTLEVPSEVQGFEKLKKGDKIDVDYYRSVAVSVLPPGSPMPSPQERTHESGGGGTGQMMKGRQVTASAEIISINRNENTVRVKGPGGKLQTVSVQDPSIQKRLQTLKPGDVVQVTYTEAAAAAIRPKKK